MPEEWIRRNETDLFIPAEIISAEIFAIIKKVKPSE